MEKIEEGTILGTTRENSFGGWSVVTGGAGGIGLAIVRRLAEAGTSVAVVERKGKDFGRVRDVCEKNSVEVLCLEADVANRSEVREAISAVQVKGGVRYAVNCAGVDDLCSTDSVSEDAWEKVMRVNLNGVVNCCLAEREFKNETDLSIVNIGSLSGMIYNQGALPHLSYNVSKSGVIHASRCLAVEWVKEGIRVNSVSPGYTRTAMTDMNSPELNRDLISHVPMGRMAEVDEIAAPVVFLLSPQSSYITGINLPVEGGILSW